MPKQPAIPGLRDAMKKKVTRHEQFLAEMDAVVPWRRLQSLIEPYYPKVGPKGGRPPMPLETMLRIYFLQNWYALSDPMAEETLDDSEAMRRFAGIELGDDRIPDETTILNFRHLLERHGQTEAIFADVNAHLADKGITLRSGTLVDATIIDAPSSTKNQAKARDPEMSSTKKGNDWYFGMKAHVGVDADSGIVHSLETTTAKTCPRQGACKGRASLPRHHAPSRSYEDPLSGAGQEPCASVHAVRARQPVPDATEARGMRRSPPKVDQIAAQAEQTARQSLDMPPVWHQNSLKRQFRCSRSR